MQANKLQSPRWQAYDSICLMSRWSLKKRNKPTMLHGCSLCVCIWPFACHSVRLSFYLSVYLFISSAAACLLPHISACLFFCVEADVSVLQVFIWDSAAEDQKEMSSRGWERPHVHLSIVPQIFFWCQTTALGGQEYLWDTGMVSW